MPWSYVRDKNGGDAGGGHRQYVMVSPGGLEYRISPYRRGAWIAVRVRPDGLPRKEVIWPDWIYDVEDLVGACQVDYASILPNGPGGAKQQVGDADFEGSFPALWWMLTTEKLPDGKERKRATISLSVQHDGWAAFLNDKQTNHYLCRSGATLDACFEALEEALGERPVAWRTNGTQTKKR